MILSASCEESAPKQNTTDGVNTPTTDGVNAPTTDGINASLKFNTIKVEDFMKHPNATEEYHGLKYTISFTYPSEHSDKAVLETLQRSFISHLLGEKYASLTPEKAVNALIEDWKAEYLKEMAEYIQDQQEYGSEYITVLPYEYEISNTIPLFTDQLLQSEAFGHWYMGGAHGSGGPWAALFNPQTGQKYSKSDIFDLRKEDDLQRLLLQEIYAIAHEYSPDADIDHDGVWTEEVNFSITPNGVTFLYVDYALGCYALGINEVPVSYAKIIPYLRIGTPVWDFAKIKRV